MVWGSIIFFLGALLIVINEKIQFLKKRKGCKKIEAEVESYKKETGGMRNDYTTLHYPYVKIEYEPDEYILVKLRYANNITKPFSIGEKVNVFWFYDDLLYWDTYEKGIYKYLPNSWNIFKNTKSTRHQS